jgi:hypothetical protein
MHDACLAFAFLALIFAPAFVASKPTTTLPPGEELDIWEN